jgi:cytochrome oxidase Cu insertion factor (SCO1/SenC/PrrC family)
MHAGRRALLARAACAAVLLWPALASLAATEGQTAPARRARVDITRLPAPGSYALARVMAAPDGMVLDSQGRAQRLHNVLRGRLSVLSFMYTYCRDPEGCPLAWAAMDGLRSALLLDPALAAVSQLVSLSFDPTNDTPHQMRLYGGERIADPRLRWHFLTTASVPQLMPLLEGFGQDVTVEVDTRGRPTRTLNHMLKLFLVDARLQVREIYSVATLDSQALLNDLRTLQLEQRAARP